MGSRSSALGPSGRALLLPGESGSEVVGASESHGTQQSDAVDRAPLLARDRESEGRAKAWIWWSSGLPVSGSRSW
jgi:hypothetical protein